MTEAPDLRALLAAARTGDRDAVGALWVRHRRFVAAVLLAHGAGPELDDLLQEVALRVTRGLGGLADGDSLRAWLRALARNVAIDHGRRRCGDVADAGSVWFDDGERQRLGDELDAVLRDLAALDPIYREPLLLRAVEGLSQREIAAALDLPETTVETRLARARRLLRERHDAHEPGASGERHDAPLRRTVDQPRHRPAR